MNSLLFVLLLLLVVVASAELFPSDSLDMFSERPWTREHLRAFRVRRDWSDRYAQMTGNSIYPWSIWSLYNNWYNY
uniref:Neuropeptide n=1 Tax=Steinernema glaseri TaxID=37863 RepID=A0A1I7YWX9_9BILA